MKCCLVLSCFVLLQLSILSGSSVYGVATDGTVPHRFLDNAFFRRLLNYVVEHSPIRPTSVYTSTWKWTGENVEPLYRPRSHTFVLYDVLNLETQIHQCLRYNLSLLFAYSGCEARKHEVKHTLAECGLSGEELLQVSALVEHDPLKPDNQAFSIIAGSISSSQIVHQLPKHPAFLGFELPKNVHSIYSLFKQQHGKQYTDQEDLTRFRIFKDNLLKIQMLQVLDRGTARYGITPFADLTEEEFKRTHANMRQRSVPPTGPAIQSYPVEKLPTKFDWREHGAVTEVKNQGMCGSCWAFAVTGNIEGHWFLKKQQLVSLSEQQLLDCDKRDEACNGGLPEWAYDTIVKMGGLMSEKDYPYEAEKEVCHWKPSNLSAYINGSVTLPKNETEMAAWLADNGPISVGVNANFLQFYFGGVSHPPHILCSDKGLDHAVLLVGYGVTPFWGRPYWIVKNSWGRSWGEKGYFRIYRGDGTCGINADATSSIIR